MKRLIPHLILILVLSGCAAPTPLMPAPASPLATPVPSVPAASPSGVPAAMTLPRGTVAPPQEAVATGLLATDTAHPTPGTAEASTHLGTLAFVREGAIWAIDLPNGQPRRLTGSGNDQEPQWSTSGQWLAYRGNGTLWVVRADGSQAHAAGCSYPQGRRLWAPAADELLCTTAGGGLAIMQADASGCRQLVPPTNGRRGDGISSAAWSPDGQALAYARDDTAVQNGEPAGVVASLRRANADGTSDRELLNLGTPSADGLRVAGWSPDGSHVLYRVVTAFSASFMADGTTLWTVPATGGAPAQVGKNLGAGGKPDAVSVLTYADFLTWPHDVADTGNELAVTFGSYRGAWTNKRVGLANAATGDARLLSPVGMAATSASWSPDGRFLAYPAMPDTGDLVGGDTARDGLMQRRIYIVNAQGEPQPRRLTDDPAYRDELPLWSADGQQILFARLDQQARASLWLISSGGGAARQIVADLSMDPQTTWFGYYGHIDWQSKFDWWQLAAGSAAPALSPAPATATKLTR